MVTWSPRLPEPECLGEETFSLFSGPRPLPNLAPMVTVPPLGSRMDKLALRTQSSRVSVAPDRGKEAEDYQSGGGGLTQPKGHGRLPGGGDA